jgi:hypothetical protein
MGLFGQVFADKGSQAFNHVRSVAVSDLLQILRGISTRPLVWLDNQLHRWIPRCDHKPCQHAGVHVTYTGDHDRLARDLAPAMRQALREQLRREGRGGV